MSKHDLQNIAASGSVADKAQLVDALGALYLVPDDVANPRERTLMFEIHGNRRSPMAEGDPVQEPTDLSPGALLRPLWQDACFPTIASIDFESIWQQLTSRNSNPDNFVSGCNSDPDTSAQQR